MIALLGACLDVGIPRAILSCNVVATHGFGSRYRKQTSRKKIKNFKFDQGSKKKLHGNRKVGKQGRPPMPAVILVDIYP